MEIVFSDYALEDYLYWKERNLAVKQKIDTLLQEIKINPTHGIGDVIALRYGWVGYYSRRVSLRHRLVYKVEKDTISIVQCRYHH